MHDAREDGSGECACVNGEERDMQPTLAQGLPPQNFGQRCTLYHIPSEDLHIEILKIQVAQFDTLTVAKEAP